MTERSTNYETSWLGQFSVPQASEPMPAESGN